METTVKFSISVTGEDSGKPYSGDFTVKTMITRRERFQADAIRRDIIGPVPEGQSVVPSLQTEAFIHGQLAVRLMDSPKWWVDAGNGLDLEDYNVILTVYDKVIELDNAKMADMQKESEEALKKLASKKSKEK